MQKKRVVYKRTKVMDFFAREDRLLAVCRVRLRTCGVEIADMWCRTGWQWQCGGITVAAVGGLAAAAARAEGK